MLSDIRAAFSAVGHPMMASFANATIRYRAGDTVILPAGKVHQIFAETSTDIVSAMPLGTAIRLPDGQLLDLPWRK